MSSVEEKRGMKRTTKRWIARVAAVCLALTGLVTAACFGWKVYSTQQEYEAGDEAYEELAKLVRIEEPDESPASSENEEENTEEEISSVNSDSIVNLEAAQEVNGDIVAWINSPDTVIDYPVCQGEDNAYYLSHLADGTYNRNGCLFIDCENAEDFSDDNTIIYGHHMASGKMFASLIKYADQGYYEDHPVMNLTVGDQQYQLEIFSGYVTTADSSAYRINCGSRHDFAEWLREICGKSDFAAKEMAIHTSDRIVTLSTCAYAFEDARYVVHGRIDMGT